MNHAEIGRVRAQLSKMEAQVNEHDRATSWKYSMEVDYTLLTIDRTLQALSQGESEPTKVNRGTLSEQNQRSNPAYNRFVDLVENRPAIWRN